MFSPRPLNHFASLLVTSPSTPHTDSSAVQSSLCIHLHTNPLWYPVRRRYSSHLQALALKDHLSLLKRLNLILEQQVGSFFYFISSPSLHSVTQSLSLFNPPPRTPQLAAMLMHSQSARPLGSYVARAHSSGLGGSACKLAQIAAACKLLQISFQTTAAELVGGWRGERGLEDRTNDDGRFEKKNTDSIRHL